MREDTVEPETCGEGPCQAVTHSERQGCRSVGCSCSVQSSALDKYIYGYAGEQRGTSAGFNMG